MSWTHVKFETSVVRKLLSCLNWDGSMEGVCVALLRLAWWSVGLRGP